MLIKNSIKNLTFFRSLNEDEIDKLSNISSLKSYNKEFILSYEQTQTDKLLFLTKGLAKAYKIDKNDNEIFLYYIQANNMLSEISTLEANTLITYSNIIFSEDSTILQIDYNLFRKYFLDKNILIREFSNEIINRSKKLETLINREFIFDAVTKVTMMIESDLDMFNKLKRHDIALMLHIQPATLSRVLNKLKKDDIIEIIHGKVLRKNNE